MRIQVGAVYAIGTASADSLKVQSQRTSPTREPRSALLPAIKPKSQIALSLPAARQATSIPIGEMYVHTMFQTGYPRSALFMEPNSENALQHFTKATGQSFYIDNKPGASAIIGVEAGKNSAPDGYTLLMASSGPLAINPTLYTKLAYDPIKDFQPIGMVAVVPQFLVATKNFPADDLKSLINYVKQNPGKVNFGSGGAGLTNHLTMEMLKSMTGMQITHVPYKGAAAAVTALVSGEVELMFESGPPVIPFIKRGQLKSLRGRQPETLACIAGSGYGRGGWRTWL